jgi:glycosyltransferase involved in cell wall biosynthesis
LTDTAHQSWSIIVLCYNEEENIVGVLQDVQQTLLKISNQDSQIVLVNDGSSDNSHQVIQDYLAAYRNDNIDYVCHSNNKGIGEALITGYQHSTSENVVMIPGDGQFDLRELWPFMNIPKKSIIAFYREENTTYSISRNVLSWVNNFLNRILLGITLKDVNWVKVYKNEELKKLQLEIRSSLVESEICAKLIYLQNNTLETRSKYLPRTGGQSKGASFKIVKQAIQDILRLVVVFRRFKNKLGQSIK